MRIRQRLQQHSIYQAENCGIRADSQSQCEHRNHREPGIFSQSARAITQVLQQSFEPRPAPLIVGYVLNHCRVAKLPARRCVGLRGRFAARLAIARGHLQMAGDFFLERFLALLAIAPWKFHASLSPAAGSRIPAIACDICAQRDRSDANFFLPAALNR